MSPKISACLIVRDDLSTLETCLKSIRPYVDEICIADTGSVDGSADLGRQYADRFEVFLECNDPETGLINDFSMARNKSLSMASGDIAFWLDGDDVLEGGSALAGLADELRKHDLAQVMAAYDYAHDANGAATVTHWRERLIYPRHRFESRWPVHENFMPIEPIEGAPLQSILTNEFKIVHRQQHSTKPREEHRNLRILKAYVRRTAGQDHRGLYYLGSEYLRAGFPGDGLRTLRRFVEVSDPKSDDHALGLLDIARCYCALGDQPMAIEWASKALMVKSWVQPYFLLVKAAHILATEGHDAEWNMRRCASFAQTALLLNPNGAHETLQTQNLNEYFEVHRYLNHALASIGMLDEALASCESGLRGLPKDEMLLNNRELWRTEIAKRNVTREAHALAARGVISPNAAKIIEHTVTGKLDGAIISGAAAQSAVNGSSVAAAPIAETKAQPGKLDIVFFLGHALEPWSPKTLEAGGMGGSETMAWELSKRLAKLGHRVRLYGHCTPTMEGLYEGVEWYDGSRYHDLTCDVLIASRRPDAVDDQYRVKAGARILWLHDCNAGDSLTYARDLRFDRVFVLSQWHKAHVTNCYPTLDPEKIVVTRNGIDLTRFAGDEPRNPHRAIVSSSPDRGLWTTLDIWPRVRLAVPDAELVVTYGFHNWQKACEMVGDTAALQSLHHLKHMAENTAGVVFRGRINQRELAKEMMRSGCWLASTWFTETFCIGAAEAQAAGLRIICTPLAALRETAGERAVMIGKGDTEGIPDPGEWRSTAYMEAFTQAVVHAMTRPESEGWAKSKTKPEGWTRNELKAYAAEAFDVETLALEWSELLGEIHADVTARVVPKFRAVEIQP